MPRATRNFWIIANVDGRATPIEAGPAAANGGFEMVILLRENGGISEKRLNVKGQALNDGTLLLAATVDGDDSVGFTVRTDR